MKESKLRAGAEVIGLVAVVVSVLLLAVEVRQGNEVARAAAAHEVLAMFDDWHDLAISDPEVAELLLRMREPEAAFDPVELRRVESLSLRLWNIWFAVHIAFENGVMSAEDYEIYTQDVQGSLNLRAALPIWRKSLETFPRTKSFPIFAPILNAPDR